MSLFRVWAPYARTVEVDIADHRTPMRKEERGWWSVEIPDAGPGTYYAFSVDHSELLPDPRSPWQPDGIHGRSRVVDHETFAWTDAEWAPPSLGEAIIYELHVGTFTSAGTFDAAIAQLDHLIDLGVTHVELLPVNEFSGSRGWGYDGVDLYAPHHAYGGPEGLKRWVNACHERGLAVLLDVVYNHLGPVGNYLSRFGPYFTNRYGTPWGEALNFDGPDSDEVRAFMIDNALMWLRDYHFDGLRLDAVHAILDTSAVHFLEQLSERVDQLATELKRPLNLIAESDLNNPRLLWPRNSGGCGMDAQWSDDFHHALHALLTGEREGYYADFGAIAHIAKALKHAYVFDGRYSDHRRRTHGRPIGDLSGHCFLGYLQNHDQIGNRARGDRIGHQISLAQAKIGATLVLTAPFVPMLFQGEEWAASSPFQYFTDHHDPQLAKAVREGRRSEFAAFGWNPKDIPDPQSEQTFQRSKLNWDERRDGAHAEMLDWYRQLIALRRSCPDLSDGRLDRLDVKYDEQAGWMAVIRGGVTVLCNLANAPQSISRSVAGAGEPILKSDPTIAVTDQHTDLTPHGVVIFQSSGS